ncbi:MAG: replication factor C large subunit [Candidatus Pacearchaeota archaeon]|jgi:replication factor C large subunit
MTQWTEKHRPKKLEDIKGQEESIEKIKKFLDEFPNKKKVLILGGPPGIGKTTLVHVFSKEMNFELFELNASDLRNKEKLQQILRPAIEQKSLTKENKIILIDEVDGITGTDRGGISELTKLIDETTYPIIATANDVWKKNLADLRKKSTIIELKNIPLNISKAVLIDILKKEDKFLNIEILSEISENSKGDLRAAINDLQAISSSQNPEEAIIDSRNKEDTIFNILREIFQEKANNEMLRAFDKTEMSIDEIMLWIEENIPNIYSGKELAQAYFKLANADLFKGRIYKQQYWRFLVYQNIFLSYGISSSKINEKKGFFKYSKPERILKIWLSNQKLSKRKSIAEKYALKTHVGSKRILREWPEIKNILKSTLIQKELKLDSEEIEYIMKN